MSYTIDRDPEVQPSLTEMAIKALDALFVAVTTPSSDDSSKSTTSNNSDSEADAQDPEQIKPEPKEADNDNANANEEEDTPGFFIMIEASRIDHAGHSNDALTHINEILEYNRVMDAVRGWIDRHAEVDGAYAPSSNLSSAFSCYVLLLYK